MERRHYYTIHIFLFVNQSICVNCQLTFKLTTTRNIRIRKITTLDGPIWTSKFVLLVVAHSIHNQPMQRNCREILQFRFKLTVKSNKKETLMFTLYVSEGDRDNIFLEMIDRLNIFYEPSPSWAVISRLSD